MHSGSALWAPVAAVTELGDAQSSRTVESGVARHWRDRLPYVSRQGAIMSSRTRDLLVRQRRIIISTFPWRRSWLGGRRGRIPNFIWHAWFRILRHRAANCILVGKAHRRTIHASACRRSAASAHAIRPSRIPCCPIAACRGALRAGAC